MLSRGCAGSSGPAVPLIVSLWHSRDETGHMPLGKALNNSRAEAGYGQSRVQHSCEYNICIECNAHSIVYRNEGSWCFARMRLYKKGEESHETLKKYAFVIGKTKPIIKLNE